LSSARSSPSSATDTHLTDSQNLIEDEKMNTVTLRPPRPSSTDGTAARRPWYRRRTIRYAAPAALVAAAVVAVITQGGGDGTPTAQRNPAAATPTAAAGRAPGDPDPTVNGCLGGKPGIGPDGTYVDLDQIVLAAQKQAPLTPTGAAEFTATLTRWYGTVPEPAGFAQTLPQVLAPGTNSLSQKLLKPVDSKWSSGRYDFSTGGFYVESFDPTHAVVSWVANGYGTANGKDIPPVIFANAAHLVAVGGVWKLTDIAPVHAAVEELQRIATPYDGGC
jgi:hypothetical protein